MGDAKKGADEQPLSLQKEEERVQLFSCHVRQFVCGRITFFRMFTNGGHDDDAQLGNKFNFPCPPHTTSGPRTGPGKSPIPPGVRPQLRWGRSCACCPADHR